MQFARLSAISSDFRKQEGAALQKKFTEKVDNIQALLASIEPYEKARVEKIKPEHRKRSAADSECGL